MNKLANLFKLIFISSPKDYTAKNKSRLLLPVLSCGLDEGGWGELECKDILSVHPGIICQLKLEKTNL